MTMHATHIHLIIALHDDYLSVMTMTIHATHIRLIIALHYNYLSVMTMTIHATHIRLIIASLNIQSLRSIIAILHKK